MSIRVISCVEQLKEYMQNHCEDNSKELWDKLVVEQYWKELCCYSPIDLSDRKPQYVPNNVILQRQVEKLEKIDLNKLTETFNEIANKLPNYDDDPITVILFPIDDNNITVKEQQNGVIGTALYGNIMLQVNPLVEGYEEWINYVFAHEYHHTVWGNYWLNMHGTELNHNLLQALVTDGEADSFAMPICNTLVPKWLYLDDDKKIEDLFDRKYKSILFKTEFDYPSLMFGNEECEICWCCGYAVGYRIVQKFLENSSYSFPELIEIHPNCLYKECV